MAEIFMSSVFMDVMCLVSISKCHLLTTHSDLCNTIFRFACAHFLTNFSFMFVVHLWTSFRDVKDTFRDRGKSPKLSLPRKT
jgi:hypothetical protein